MAKKAAKTQKLTVLLVKDSLSFFEEALRDPSSLTRVQVKSDVGFTGELWYAKPQSRSPQWKEFVAPALVSKIENLNTSSVSAVLFVKAKNRIFAFTFGYGRNLLKPNCYEPGFGLRVALNRIDHRQIRSLDLRTYEDLVVSTRKQTSRSSELATFGLDVARDLLRAATGEPSDTTFAKRVTGTDSLTLNVPVTPAGLGKKCEEILKAYKDDNYKEHFDWIDHLKEIRDEGVIDTLNGKLLWALKHEETEKLHLAAPEPLDWQSIEKFRIGGTRQTEYDDIDIDAYLATLGDKKSELTAEKLKSYRVSLRFTGNEIFQDKWSVYSCLVWDTTENHRLYAIVEGKWFEIEKSFSERVCKFVRAIRVPSQQLPQTKAGEREEDYNQRVAIEEPTRYICLDRQLVKPEDAASGIEFCDLLSADKQFIHVKKKTRSATLSHLFAQGTVAARAFLEDRSVRKQVREILKEGSSAYQSARTKKTFNGVSLIPDESTRPTSGDYEVAYAVITKPSGNWPSSLPFFSQLNLMQHAKLLRGLGYKISLQQIVESSPRGFATP